MNKFNWYFGQLVSEGHMDQAFDNAEQADRDTVSDFGFIGITDGLDGTPGVGAKEIDVTAGTAYDNSGRRIRLAAPELADLSIDSDGAPINNPGGGNVLWTAIFVKFDLALSNVQVDGTGTEIQFNVDESYELIVRQAPEDVLMSATRPIGNPDEVKLMDVRIDPATVVIPGGNIDLTNRQFAFDAVTANYSVREGKIGAFAVGLLNAVESISAAATAFDGLQLSTVWTNARTTTDMQTAIEGLADDFESVLAGDSGAHKVSLETGAVSAFRDWGNLGAAVNVAEMLDLTIDLADGVTGVGGAGKIELAPGNLVVPAVPPDVNWDNMVGPGGGQSMNAVLQGLMDDMARHSGFSAETGSTNMGMDGFNTLRDTTIPVPNNLHAWLNSLVAEIAGDDGGQKLGMNDLVTDSASDVSALSQRIDRSSGVESVEDFCHGNQIEITNRVVQKIVSVETPVGLDVGSVPNWSEDHSPNAGEPNLLMEASMGGDLYARMYVDNRVGLLFTVNAKMDHASNVWIRDDVAIGSNVFGGLPSRDGPAPGLGASMGFAHRPAGDADTWISDDWVAGTGEQVYFDCDAGNGTIVMPGGTNTGAET